MIIAEITGNLASAAGLLGAALGVGLIGTKAAEAVGLKTEENEFVSILEVDFRVEGGPGFLYCAD